MTSLTPSDSVEVLDLRLWLSNVFYYSSGQIKAGFTFGLGSALGLMSFGILPFKPRHFWNMLATLARTCTETRGGSQVCNSLLWICLLTEKWDWFLEFYNIMFSLRSELMPLGSTDLHVVAAVKQHDSDPQGGTDGGEQSIKSQALLVLREDPQQPVYIHQG